MMSGCELQCKVKFVVVSLLLLLFYFRCCRCEYVVTQILLHFAAFVQCVCSSFACTTSMTEFSITMNLTTTLFSRANAMKVDMRFYALCFWKYDSSLCFALKIVCTFVLKSQADSQVFPFWYCKCILRFYYSFRRLPFHLCNWNIATRIFHRFIPWHRQCFFFLRVAFVFARTHRISQRQCERYGRSKKSYTNT